MTHQSIPFGAVVRLHWYDSSSQTGWKYKPESAVDPGRIKSVGFVVNTSKSAITITTSMEVGGGYIDPLTIPWGAVMKVEELEDEIPEDEPEIA